MSDFFLDEAEQGQVVQMVHIDTPSTVESFRWFLINSTCRTFIPESYLRDPEVFPEKEGEPGSIYVEAADKVTLKKIREITFINARDVLGIIYSSKSGNSRLKWRQMRGRLGRVTGEASANSLVNLFMARVIEREYAEKLIGKEGVLGASSERQAPKREEDETFVEEEEASPIAETLERAESPDKGEVG